MRYSVLALALFTANAAARRFPLRHGDNHRHNHGRPCGDALTHTETKVVTVTAAQEPQVSVTSQVEVITTVLEPKPEPETTTLVTRKSSTSQAPAPTATSSPPPSNGLTEDQQAALDAHNKARAEVGTEPLVWDEDLTAGAQEYADHLASTQTFEHSGAEGVGENLYMQSAGDSPFLHSADAYISEKSDYDGSPINENNYSHYTQVVWKDTTAVGMAVGVASNGDQYVVCRYSPPGNVIGQAAF